MNLFDKGWECPKCGAVMSPTTSVCVNCRGQTKTVNNLNRVEEQFKFPTTLLGNSQLEPKFNESEGEG